MQLSAMFLGLALVVACVGVMARNQSARTQPYMHGPTAFHEFAWLIGAFILLMAAGIAYWLGG